MTLVEGITHFFKNKSTQPRENFSATENLPTAETLITQNPDADEGRRRRNKLAEFMASNNT